MLKFCPKCGVVIKNPKQKYCGDCGTYVGDERTAASEPINSKNKSTIEVVSLSSKQFAKNKWVLRFICLAFVLFALFLLYSLHL